MLTFLARACTAARFVKSPAFSVPARRHSTLACVLLLLAGCNGHGGGASQTVTTSTGEAATFTPSTGNLNNLRRETDQTEINAFTASLPTGVEAPAGFFSFDVSDLFPGGTISVVIKLPAGVVPTGYVKCSPTTHQCVQLPGSRVSISGNVITISLTDGLAPGDADGQANGRIVDPGAPVVSYVPLTWDEGSWDQTNWQ